MYLICPKFVMKLSLPAVTLALDTPTKEDFDIMAAGRYTVPFVNEIIKKYSGQDIPLTQHTAAEFVSGFLDRLSKYKADNMDYLEVPEKMIFGKKEQDEADEKKCPFPILFYGENLVYGYSGYNFEEQKKLKIIEYWALLADAAKVQMMNGMDGAKHLKRCYNDMHKIDSFK